MCLAVSDLACSRAGQILFTGVTFALRRGETATIRGANGSGKTTLLLAIAGLMKPTAGAVLWEGATASPAIAAYAGHGDALKPELTPSENLMSWCRIFGADPRRVPEAMNRFGLTRKADLPVGKCSAGERRRTALARILVTGRRLWLLDEPGVHLDPQGKATLEEMLHGHAAAGGCAVVVTHDETGPAAQASIDLGAARRPRKGSFLDWQC